MIELIVNRVKEQKEIALVENGKLIEFYRDSKDSNRNEGNVYVGVVKNIIKGMQSAFVDIGTEKNGFIHLKEAMNKIDETVDKVDTNIDINDILKKGQKILVQVRKDSNDKKGARVSTHISLPSKYIVLMPNTEIVTVSQKIEDKKEQQRLIKLVKENLTKGNGAVIRTSAIAKNDEIIKDIKEVENKWQAISKKADLEMQNNENEAKLIYKSEEIEQKIIIDIAALQEIKKITVNNKKEYDDFNELKLKMIELENTEIELKENQDVLDKYDLKKEIEKIGNRKVWLNCGGFITIDATEALTAIDVNTGKYTGNKNLNQTIYKVNQEATIEIAKQIRLRDIGGIIIIDYIDMAERETKNKIQELLIQKLKNDRAKTQVEGFTKLDLMELTRKHICSHRPEQNIEE